ncbi:DUF1080 domain-containing protein [Telmatocola sphagniphila]|uniref:DUF1080 domain-containing protein n=1 Tax=Telmatocola sphagniphila TaxID=1123043 RepID=A0A8E6EX20_9BACT|nr:DUF1080 domain-containing protein [Telmatocola sphagniphila]QVL34615.1 DUF1080 domain-containing protein [Telmatocola sphagniphila]
MKNLGLVWALTLFGLSTTATAETPWLDLLKESNLKAFKPNRAKEGDYLWAEAVQLDEKSMKTILATGRGAILVNGTKGRSPDLYTVNEYGDLEVEVEFMIAKGSNSGIKFHGWYEVQILDTFASKKLSGDSMGGIYPRAEDKPSYHHIDDGIPPRVNAAKPAGEWNKLTVIFLAPRFEAQGKKIANAKIVKAILNEQLIHENQEMKTPTGSNWNKAERAKGPFMLQMDHGPVAFRQVRIREYSAGK